MFRCFLAIALLLGSLFRPVVAADRNLVVYFPDYRFKAGVAPTLYDTTHLILFSAKPEGDGSVDFSRITPGMIEMGRQARAEREKLKIQFCVGGWGRGPVFGDAVSTEENRRRFVEALVDFCAEHGFDGVDIDWEYPKTEKEHNDFTRFLTELSARLHSENRILTVALGETRPLSNEAYALIDQVNLMSYQPWNPPKTSYVEWLGGSVQRMLDSGLPPEKLNVGIPFYTKEMGGDRRAISWSKLVGLNVVPLPESEHGFSPYGKPICDMRVDLVKRLGLGGVMVWDYGHDSPEPEHSLLRYLSEKLGKQE